MGCNTYTPLLLPRSTCLYGICSPPLRRFDNNSHGGSQLPFVARLLTKPVDMIHTRQPRRTSKRRNTPSMVVEASENIVRLSAANYHPNLWGDNFLSFSPDYMKLDAWQKEAAILKEKAREKLINLSSTKSGYGEHLKMIDTIQRLGITYHFQKEIEQALNQISNHHHLQDLEANDQYDSMLLVSALRFRLLREHGYNASSAIFNKLKDGNNSLKESLKASNVQDLLSLYEASYLRVHGEDILDEALEFTTSSLQEMLPHLKPCPAKQVQHALSRPMRKAFPRIYAWEFMSLYQEEELNDEVLLKFAKLDYNIVQNQHRHELSIILKYVTSSISYDKKNPYIFLLSFPLFPWLKILIGFTLDMPLHKYISCLLDFKLMRYIFIYTFTTRIKIQALLSLPFFRWAKSLEVEVNFPFARQRPVECYIWALGTYFEPQYALGRKFLTKILVMGTILDDIFDNVYGIHDELELFTHAFGRWDIGAMDKLPKYMTIWLKAYLELLDEIEEELAKSGRSFAVHYVNEAMKRTVRSYNQESKWLREGRKIPTMEEYQKVALVSIGYELATMTSLVGLGDIATKQAFNWFSSGPQILRAICLIFRFMDDLVTHPFEQQREHIPSAVECYMHQYGVLEEEACREISKQVENAWKDINEAFLDPRTPPRPLLMPVLNLSRVSDFLYKEDDIYTNCTKLRHYVVSLLVDPIEI